MKRNKHLSVTQTLVLRPGMLEGMGEMNDTYRRTNGYSIAQGETSSVAQASIRMRLG